MIYYKGKKFADTLGVELPATEEKVVDLNLASGNQEVLPTENKLMNKVTINKPENLIAENIKQGVNIAGVSGSLSSVEGFGRNSVIKLVVSHNDISPTDDEITIDREVNNVFETIKSINLFDYDGYISLTVVVHQDTNIRVRHPSGTDVTWARVQGLRVNDGYVENFGVIPGEFEFNTEGYDLIGIYIEIDNS